MSNRRTIDDEDEDGLFDENDDDSDEEDIVPAKKKTLTKKRKAGGDDTNKGSIKKKKKPKFSLIDDAAEESGEEDGGGDDDDDEDEDDDDDNNDYVKDGFVVDEDEEEEVRKKKKSSGELEDSDDEGDDDDDEDDDEDTKIKKKKAKKFRKLREVDRLAEEDLDLIREARGETERERLERERQEAARRKVVAQNEAELRKGLFYDDSGGEEETSRGPKEQRRMVERYDEDGMDDFIDDDIGDQGEILASERRAAYEGADGGGGVSEAQLNEASEIFGTDYLEFMQEEVREDDDDDDLFGKRRYRERGVGVDLGVDSDESEDYEDDMDDEDDEDDLFGDDDEDQKAEALKLRREKKILARKERKQQRLKLKNDKRKAQLRKAFEPVQLVENFCTDRDDEIRQKDVPERFFDWSIPFHGKAEGELTPEEEEEAIWIMNRIPDIRSEYTAPRDSIEAIEAQEHSVTQSIAHALRFMHEEKLEPAFIKRYRKDVITSPAVRENLYAIMDEDAEWEIMLSAKDKVDTLLQSIARDMQNVDAAGAQVESVQKLQESLDVAEKKLDETAKQETEVKAELEALGPIEEKDDEDELFADDDDDDEEVSFCVLLIPCATFLQVNASYNI